MRQQPVIDLINIREVVDRITLRIFVIHAILIVKNGMEPDILECRDLARPVQIATIGITQRKIRASRSEHLLPEMRKGSGGS